MNRLTAKLHRMLDLYNYCKDRGQKITALYYKGRADALQELITELEVAHAKQ